jgi:YbbR domain-containing protein
VDRFLKNSAVLRIIALILACTIWIGVNTPSNGGFGANTGLTERFAYPVHVDVAPDMVVTQIDKPTVEVAVSGDTLLVTSLPSAMMSVVVNADARGLGPGKHVLQLTAANMPPVHYSIEPSSVTVDIEKKITAEKNVHVNLQGKPSSGYEAGAPVTDTQTVQVTGVSQSVQDVVAVQANVSLQGATKALTQVVNLLPVDQQGKAIAGVELSPATVTVTVPIQPPQVTANLVPQIVGSPATGFAIAGVDLSTNSVIVSGSPTVTSNLQNMNLPIDVTGFRATQIVHLKIPLHSGMTKVEPSMIDATVKIEQSAAKSFTGIPIQVQNVPKDKQVKLTGTKTVDVTVIGPASVVNGMNETDIQVFVDGSKLTANSTSAPVQVSLPDWVKASTLSNNTVAIQVM